MTPSDQSDMSQLTIDGGEVKHPPPRPKAQCRECFKYVSLTDRGEYHRHNAHLGELCPNSGRRFER